MVKVTLNREAITPLRSLADNGGVRVLPLRSYNVPDIADHVIHFTGRTGSRFDPDPDIWRMSAEERLLHILVDRRIRGFRVFRSQEPVVCLTESVQPAVAALIGRGRYCPYGIAFSKQFAFDRHGGPTFYVRGDEWEHVEGLPQPLRSRMVLFWPGAIVEDELGLPSHLRTVSEWLHEREWRVPGSIAFEWSDVAFLLVPDIAWQVSWSGWIADRVGAASAELFRSIPAVAIDGDGGLLEDGHGLWSSPAGVGA